MRGRDVWQYVEIPLFVDYSPTLGDNSVWVPAGGTIGK